MSKRRLAWYSCLTASWLMFVVSSSAAAPPTWTDLEKPREPRGFLSHLDDLKLEVGGLFALLTYSGIRDWKWGTAYFRFNNEHWFGMNAGSGGIDKVGHAYSSYLMTEFLFLRLRTRYGERAAVTLYPPLFTWTLMLYVEVFDGFSVDHGFSYEDLIMDTVGISAAFFRNLFPSVGEFFNYRMEYFPSRSQKGFHPMIDYEGQKFLVALRPSGFQFLRGLPFQFFELYLGYYTRGFKDNSASMKHARLYAGFGVDLQRVLAVAVGEPAKPGGVLDYVNTALGAFQFPYGYPDTTIHERRELK